MAEVAAAVGTEIRILGPVELWRDGEPVHVGGPRQRALLLVLVLRANETVSSGRLLEELFGADAPATSANAVQAAVSRLRRLLEPGALETRGAGYVLHVDPERLDSVRFERLLAEGRAQLAGGDAASAAATLRDALSLWRGSPLGDLAALEFAQADARRLDELRMVGVMDRIEAELGLGAAHELVPELESLVAENPLRERLRGQLMLALYRCGRQADALAVYRETRRLLREELGLEPGRALQELERAILRQDAELEPAAAAAEPVVLCPFKGLAAFTTGDAPYYFGRERLVDEVIARLVDHPFVGLVGSSGSGKSSLLQAGVLTALAAGALPGSSGWRRAVVRPGAHPLAALLGDVGVLAVDQLEEAFTTCRDDDERAAFFDELARRAHDGSVVLVALRADFYGRCAAYPEFASLLSANHVLLGAMQRDELAHAIEGPAERAGLQAERELVDLLVGDVASEPGALPLLSTTLVELWRRRTGRVLTAASYRESGGVRGAVARLAEQAFAQLSGGEQRAARAVMLRLADEEDGAIVRRRVPIEELDVATDDDVARVVGVLTEARLLTVAEGTVEVSHESLLAEWPRLRGWLDEDRDGRRLHGHLATSARDWDARGREPADLYRGPRLGAALDWSTDHGDELNALEREFLDAARAEHERELAEQRRRSRRLGTLAAVAGVLLVLALVGGAVALAQRRDARDQATAALARQLGAEAVSTPRIDQAMLLAHEAVELNRSPQTEGTLLATLLRSPAAVATFTTPILSRPQAIVLSPDGRTLAESDNQRTVTFYDTGTQRVLRVLPHLGYTNAVAYTPDGTRFAAFAGTNAPEIDVLDARTYRRLRVLHLDRQWLRVPTGGGAPLLITPDGRTLLYAYDLTRPDGSDGPAFLDRWNLRTGKLLSTTPLGITGAKSANLFQDGRRLAVGGTRAVAILNVRTPRRVRTLRLPSASPVQSEATSPDGRTIAFGNTAGLVSFLDAATGSVTPGIGGHSASVQDLRFSPDGRIVVSVSNDGAVIVWDPATAQPVERLLGHESDVHGLALSRDGRTLFTSSLDGAIFEWDLGTARRFGVPFRAPGIPNAENLASAHLEPPLAVSPTGSEFAIRAGEKSVRLLDTRSAREIAGFPVRTSSVTWLAFAPKAPVLAVTGAEGLVQLWNVAGRPRLQRTLAGVHSINGSPETISTAAFSPDGRLLAVGDVNHTPGATPYRFGTVAVWNVRTGRLLWRVRNRHGWVHTVAFSPSGQLLAAAQEDGVVRIYDPSTGRLLRSLTLYGGTAANALLPDTLAFAPTGLLATGTWAGILQLWNPSTGKATGRPTKVAALPVSSIAFDPTGTIVATGGGGDGLAKLWTLPGVQRYGADFPGHPSIWTHTAYTPDGSKLIVVFTDGGGVVWPASVTAWMGHACKVAGRNLTREEWSRFVGNRSYAKTCA
jgi:WD40 repeat protein/DNA-binding SARP family transcriptional activator